MKKIRLISLIVLVALTVTLFAGCGASNVQYEVASYTGQVAEGQTKSEYNKEVFYRNDFKVSGADPFVLDNTARDGYYYIYVTEGSLLCSRSKDLMEWEIVGNSLDNLDYAEPSGMTEVRRTTYKDVWAPEVIYDEDTQKYYMFFSASPQEETIKTGEGVMSGTAFELPMVAVSDYPDRDFQLVNFKDPESCGEENVHTYNETPGISDGNGGYLDAFPHYFAKYLLFDPAEYKAFAEANGGFRGEFRGGYEGGIDPHPFVAANGDKYLFWVDSAGEDRLSAVKMINWLKPDWSTATVLTYHGFYTVEDWKTSQSGQPVDKVSYELESVTINEGPCVLEHNGKYYLTYSVNAYADSSYQVAQAVADDILGPYRKLTEEEGGILISGNTQGSLDSSGTGHHGIVAVKDQLFIIYHRHNDVIVAGGARNPAVDELKWVTIKDKFGNDLDVLYTNGPTTTPQPKIEAYSDYRNIAPEANVSGVDSKEYLVDGLLSTYKYANPDFVQYIQETFIDKTSTMTFEFDDPRTVKAIMVYNSKMETTAFGAIARIEMDCVEDGKTVTRFIRDIPVASDCYMANEYDGSFYYIVPGAATYAEFDELNVKTIRITIEVPEGQEEVGISEVRILGK